ncbi:efflux RND transporter periplasmic adaptor subunit [Haliea atlantica]
MSKAIIMTGVIMLGLGLAGGYWLSQDNAGDTVAEVGEPEPLYYRNPMNPGVTSPVPAQDSMGMDYLPVYAEEAGSTTEPEILYYRNPMNPSVTSPTPMKDSMGMDYVPVYAEGESSDVVGTVKIDPVVVQNIGVRTAIAKSESISRTIRTVGRVDFNEERMARLHPKVQGWIEELYVDKTGETVASDDILLSIYSPQLVSTQQEYLLALNNLAALGESPFEEIREGARDLVKSSRERLQFLDVPEHQIEELETSREIKKSIHIHSPVDGTVLRIGVRQRQHVTPQQELYMLADLSEVWVLADIYENEIPWVNVGDEVEMTLTSVPGKTFTGEVAYIYPYSEAKTRTTKVRLVFDNPDLLLRPDMFAEVKILSDTREKSVVVPSEAVVRSGGNPQIFVVRDPGKFEPRTVRLGVESGGRVEVLDGVSDGEEVVTSAQFLVDSESKLREATAKMMDALKGEDIQAEADHSAQSGGRKNMDGNDSEMSEAQGDARSDTGHETSDEPDHEMGEDAHGGMVHD